MATDILLVSKSVKGEARRHGHDGAIELHSVSFGARRPVGSADRPNVTTAFSTIDVQASMEAGVAEMIAMAIIGKPMAEVSIIQYRAGGDDDVMIWTMTLTDVLIESFKLAGGGTETDRLPEVRFELAYVKCSMVYMPQNKTGLAVNPVQFEYDLSIFQNA